MEQSVIHILWSEGGTSRLSEMPWSSLKDDPTNLVIKNFNWKDNIKKLVEDSAKKGPVLIIADINDEKQLEKATKLTDNEDFICIILISPQTIVEDAEALSKVNRKICVLQKPVRYSEVILLLHNIILMRYYRTKMKNLEKDEVDWLMRLEKVFEFSRQEMLDKEKTTMAYESLLQYENRLLLEQQKINKALLALQEYRDKEQMEWNKEKEARANVENMLTGELKDSIDTVKAQENLIEYNRKEKLVFYKLLKKFEHEGTLTDREIKSLLDEHQILLDELEDFNGSKIN